MKREVYKATELPKDLSPTTPNGELVYSTLRATSHIEDGKRVDYRETLTPDAEDAMKVLRFLDEINGIGWTPTLKKIEVDLREALHQLWRAE